jgi:starch phosphorylase
MKVLVNGGLNLSELEGWWAEAYSPDCGWALGDGTEHNGDPARDAAEAEALYRIIEEQVIPAFYTRDQRGIPTQWIARMRGSMAELTPRFSANRVVREYVENYYVSAATAYHRRARNQGDASVSLLKWQEKLNQHWANVRFGELRVETSADKHWFRLQVYLGGLAPETVRVELYADSPNGEAPFRRPMNLGSQLAGSANGYLYEADVPAVRSASDYTPRIIPSHSVAQIPLEDAHILWFR